MDIKRRVEKLEAQIGPGKLPMSKRPFTAWDTEDSTAEEQIEKRKKELLELYGTTEGFMPIAVRWINTKE